ncbi:uncharacterized protein LOC143996252 [Lithobates pipiens]
MACLTWLILCYSSQFLLLHAPTVCSPDISMNKVGFIALHRTSWRKESVHCQRMGKHHLQGSRTSDVLSLSPGYSRPALACDWTVKEHARSNSESWWNEIGEVSGTWMTDVHLVVSSSVPHHTANLF